MDPGYQVHPSRISNVQSIAESPEDWEDISTDDSDDDDEYLDELDDEVDEDDLQYSTTYSPGKRKYSSPDDTSRKRGRTANPFHRWNPNAIDNILYQFPELVEFRELAHRYDSMEELQDSIKPASDDYQDLSQNPELEIDRSTLDSETLSLSSATGTIESQENFGGDAASQDLNSNLEASISVMPSTESENLSHQARDKMALAESWNRVKEVVDRVTRERAHETLKPETISSIQDTPRRIKAKKGEKPLPKSRDLIGTDERAEPLLSFARLRLFDAKYSKAHTNTRSKEQEIRKEINDTHQNYHAYAQYLRENDQWHNRSNELKRADMSASPIPSKEFYGYAYSTTEMIDATPERRHHMMLYNTYLWVNGHGKGSYLYSI
ncbi:hypothetical protein ABW19_dt0204676 [Dactylella cylindrospora]|nr:hypothetical protein ABW19_dt0204676 [Dactylella cylindrospora]